MGANPTQPLTAAERMRRYRRRRQAGSACIRISVHASQIDALIKMGLLKKEQRRDPDGLESALYGVLDWALEDRALREKIARAMSPVGT
jgi:hypothetical protein